MPEIKPGQLWRRTDPDSIIVYVFVTGINDERVMENVWLCNMHYRGGGVGMHHHWHPDTFAVLCELISDA